MKNRMFFFCLIFFYTRVVLVEVIAREASLLDNLRSDDIETDIISGSITVVMVKSDQGEYRILDIILTRLTVMLLDEMLYAVFRNIVEMKIVGLDIFNSDDISFPVHLKKISFFKLRSGNCNFYLKYLKNLEIFEISQTRKITDISEIKFPLEVSTINLAVRRIHKCFKCLKSLTKLTTFCAPLDLFSEERSIDFPDGLKYVIMYISEFDLECFEFAKLPNLDLLTLAFLNGGNITVGSYVRCTNYLKILVVSNGEYTYGDLSTSKVENLAIYGEDINLRRIKLPKYLVTLKLVGNFKLLSCNYFLSSENLILLDLRKSNIFEKFKLSQESSIFLKRFLSIQKQESEDNNAQRIS